jgi:hypothetical protein
LEPFDLAAGQTLAHGGDVKWHKYRS